MFYMKQLFMYPCLFPFLRGACSEMLNISEQIENPKVLTDSGDGDAKKGVKLGKRRRVL